MLLEDIEKELQKKRIKYDVYNEIAKCPYEIYIWGAGSMAKEVRKRLEEKNIEVKGYVIDIVNNSMDPVVDNNIFDINHLMENDKNIGIVMGHGHYENINKLDQYPCVKKIYIIANPYIQYQGPGEIWMSKNIHRISKLIEELDALSQKCLCAYYLVQNTYDAKFIINREFILKNIFDLVGKIGGQEVYVDVGAYTGDTVETFINESHNKYKKIIAIEPNTIAFEKLLENNRLNNAVRLECCGLGEENETMFMDVNEMQSTHMDSSKYGKQEVDIYKYDDLLGDEEVTILKVFVPFMALSILKGAENSIKKYMPKLIINVGADNGTHILDVIEWIYNLEIGYSVKLRYDFPMPTRLLVFAEVQEDYKR